jgi:hypothetical protein
MKESQPVILLMFSSSEYVLSLVSFEDFGLPDAQSVLSQTASNGSGSDLEHTIRMDRTNRWLVQTT